MDGFTIIIITAGFCLTLIFIVGIICECIAKCSESKWSSKRDDDKEVIE